jgi:hypothetical protein
MDIRVIKTRLENVLTDGSSDAFLRQQVTEIVNDLNDEIAVSDRTIDSGMVSTVVDDLRQYYFKLIDEYGALPKTVANMVKRANLLDDMMITLSKIVNYMGYAISRNASSSDPSIQRVCAVLKPELENYKKEIYNLGTLMQNVLIDKKIYMEKLRAKNDR